MKFARLVAFVSLTLGIIFLLLPNSKEYRDFFDRNPYFRKLDAAYLFLTTFEPEKTESDGKQSEKSITRPAEGFDELLRILQLNSEKVKSLDVNQITNRREFGLTDSSGNQIHGLNVIFVRSAAGFIQYVAVTSDIELGKWIRGFKKMWMLFLSGFFVFVSALIFLWCSLIAKKFQARAIIWTVLLFFLGIPVACCLYGALSLKDLLGYIWIIPVTIVALFQDQMKARLFAPKADMEFNLSGPFCLKTVIKKQAAFGLINEEYAYYFRFRVKNLGDTQLKFAECLIEELWRFEKDEWIKDSNFQHVNLSWSNGKSQNEFLNINPNFRGWFCDLVHLEKGHYYEPSNSVYEKPVEVLKPKLFFDYLPPFPNSQYHEVQSSVRHKVKVAVYSENAAPIVSFFEIFWSGIWQDNINDMFKEIRISLSR